MSTCEIHLSVIFMISSSWHVVTFYLNSHTNIEKKTFDLEYSIRGPHIPQEGYLCDIEAV